MSGAGQVAVPFVGRQDELRALNSLAVSVREGQSQVALIQGAGGSGKTQLVRELANSLTDFRTVWVSVGILRDTTEPLAAATLLRDAVGVALDSDASIFQEQGRPSRFVLAGAILSSISALSAAGPVLLVLDDAEAMDEESLELISFLFSRLDADAVLSLLVGRDGSPLRRLLSANGWRRSPVELTLRPLDEEAVAALCQAAPHYAERDGARIWRITGGNALFVVCLLFQDPEGHYLASGGVPRSLSEAVRGIVGSRRPAEIAVLEALATLGTPAGIRRIGAVLEIPCGPEDAEQLITADLLQWEGAAQDTEILGFQQILVQEAVYQSIPRHRRRQLHERCARITEGIGHWRHRVAAAEGVDEVLADSLEEAAAEAIDDGRLGQAASLLLWSADLTGSAQARGLRLLAGVRQLVIVARERQAQEFENEVRELVPSALRTEVLGLLAFTGGRLASARDLLEQAGTAAEAEGNRPLARRVNLEQALVCSVLGLGSETIDAVRNFEADDATPAWRSFARGLLTLGTALRDSPQVALDLVRDLPEDPAAVPTVRSAELLQRGILRNVLGAADQAMGDLSSVLRRSDEAVIHAFGAAPYVHHTLAAYLAGEWERARATAAAASDFLHHHRHRFDSSLLHSLTAILDAGAGDTGTALAHIDQAQELMAGADTPGSLVHVSVARAALAEAEGDFLEVVQLLRPISEDDRPSDRQRLYSVWWRPTLGWAQIVCGQLEAAERTLATLRTTPSLGGWIADSIGWLEGRLCEARGDHPGARKAYSGAVRRAETAGRRTWYGARLREAYARFLIAVGDRDEGLAALAAAETAYARIGADPFLLSTREAIRAADSVAPPVWLSMLTGREREIAMHVGKGWTTPEIASAMFLSPKTIEYHLRNSYIKLGFTSRRQLRDAVRELDEPTRRDG